MSVSLFYGLGSFHYPQKPQHFVLCYQLPQFQITGSSGAISLGVSYLLVEVLRATFHKISFLLNPCFFFFQLHNPQLWIQLKTTHVCFLQFFFQYITENLGQYCRFFLSSSGELWAIPFDVLHTSSFLEFIAVEVPCAGCDKPLDHLLLVIYRYLSTSISGS